MAGSFDYRLFGLRIHSEIELPELPLERPSAGADVTVRIGAVPPAPSGPGPHAVEGGLLLPIHEVGRFFVRDGAEIVVEPDPGVPEANVRLFLLGSAMGALLHQRGLLPLHANAVEIDGKAVAFMGGSGSGKSTLAAWLHDRGYRIIADDVCVVRFDQAGRALASPGLPRLRLWKEALEASGREASLHTLSYAGRGQIEKYDVPIANPSAVAAEIELAAVYLLGKGDDLSIQQLLGVEAAEAVLANTYRGGYIPIAKTMREYWASCVALVRGTPVFSAERSWGLEKLDEQGARMLDHARELIGRREAPPSGAKVAPPIEFVDENAGRQRGQ